MKALLGCVAAATLALAACGSSAKSSTSGTTSATGSATSASSSPATGGPIVIGAPTLDKASDGSTSESSVADGFEAWAQQVNASGGIDGRPVKVDRCNDGQQPQLNQQCAEAMINNPQVLLSAGGLSSLNAFVSVPLFQKAGIAYVPPLDLGSSEWTAPNVFSPGSGTLGTFIGMPEFMVKSLGCSKVAMLYVNLALLTPLVKAATAAVQTAGGTMSAAVAVPTNASDFLPYVTQAARSGAKCLMLGVYPNVFGNIVQAVVQGGFALTIGTPAGSTDLSGLTLAGQKGVKVLENIDFPGITPSYSAYPQFVAAMQAYGEPVTSSKLAAGGGANGALQGWADGEFVEVALKAAAKAGPLTRASILQTLKTGSFVAPPWVGTLSLKNAPAAYPAVANLNTFFIYATATTLTYVSTQPFVVRP